MDHTSVYFGVPGESELATLTAVDSSLFHRDDIEAIFSEFWHRQKGPEPHWHRIFFGFRASAIRHGIAVANLPILHAYMLRHFDMQPAKSPCGLFYIYRGPMTATSNIEIFRYLLSKYGMGI